MIEFDKPDDVAQGSTLIPTRLITDPAMTGNAVRLVALILAQPPRAKLTRADMQKVLGIGDYALDTAIRKAEAVGWLRRERVTEKRGGGPQMRYSLNLNPRPPAPTGCDRQTFEELFGK